MPRGKRSGARQRTWTVALTPAEFALLEVVRGTTARADFLVSCALHRAAQIRDLPEEKVHPDFRVAHLGMQRQVKEALAMLKVENWENLSPNREGRGGRPPKASPRAPEDVAASYARMRRDPSLRDYLVDAFADAQEEEP